VEVERIIVEKVLVPKRMILKDKLYEITSIDPKYVIKKYEVKLVDNKIDSITMDVPHPNTDPENKEFCIPAELRECAFSKEIKELVEHYLTSFNLDYCYFLPLEKIQYRDFA